LGRVTLNPRAHIDPGGAILFLLVFVGWGKPTPVDPMNMYVDPRRGIALVSAAGPVSNVLLATLLAVPFRAGLVEWRSPAFNAPFSGGTAESVVADFLVYGILLNSFLAVFNLIPLPPLDGFKLAVGILPVPAARKFNQLGRYGFGPLGVLLFLEFLTPVSVLSGVLVPFADLIIESASGHSVR
jgi:Zn-dependent protease